MLRKIPKQRRSQNPIRFQSSATLFWETQISHTVLGEDVPNPRRGSSMNMLSNLNLLI